MFELGAHIQVKCRIKSENERAMPSISQSILCLFVAIVANVAMASESAPVPPSGIWFWADKGKPATRSVSVKRQGNDIEFKLDGEPIAIQRSGKSLSFRLENDERFEGEILDASSITGTWYQPRGDYFYSSMATQVELAISESGWTSSQVNLQPRPFHLFLDFFKMNPRSHSQRYETQSAMTFFALRGLTSFRTPLRAIVGY